MQPPSEWNQEGDSAIPVEGVVHCEFLVGDDEEDTKLLREMAKEAETYLRSFPWCGKIISSFFGGGVGGVFAVFLLRIDPPPPGVGPWTWVVVGDIAPAYLPFEDCKSPAEVFKTYMWGMNNWVALARQSRTGTSAENVPPLDVPATPEWADKIQHKLHLLTLLVKPFFSETGDSTELN
ncbi:MAG TPA: hypothetical protein VIH89_01860 [Candidatus Sulfotelmatobacter sp.]|jgi:hypothetical protein